MEHRPTWAWCETGDLVMSAVTLGELEVGFAKSGDYFFSTNVPST